MVYDTNYTVGKVEVKIMLLLDSLPWSWCVAATPALYTIVSACRVRHDWDVTETIIAVHVLSYLILTLLVKTATRFIGLEILQLVRFLHTIHTNEVFENRMREIYLLGNLRVASRESESQLNLPRAPSNSFGRNWTFMHALHFFLFMLFSQWWSLVKCFRFIFL